MFLRATTRKKDGKTHRYWRLVENVGWDGASSSARLRNSVSSMVKGAFAPRALARHLIGSPEQGQLFDDGHADITVPARLKGIRVERAEPLRLPGRSVAAEALCLPRYARQRAQHE